MPWILGGVSLLAGQGWAVDRYDVSAPASAMIGGPAIQFTVDPRQSGAADPTPHLVKFINLPAGVRVTPLAAKGIPVEGTTRFTLSVDPSVTPGSITLQVQKSNSSKIQGVANILLERPVARFILAPLDLAYQGRAGDPLRLQMIASDEAGAVVTSFKGPVDFSAEGVRIEGAEVPGEGFTEGMARVTLRFTQVDQPGPHRLTLRAREGFGGRPPAEASIDVGIQAP